MRFALGFISAILLLVVVGLALIWTGAYNVAAASGHSGAVRWLLDSALRNSVDARVDEAAMSPQRVQQADLRAGLREFQEYCVHCHGAPGVTPHEWTRGMTPSPPELSQVAGEWSAAEIFWIAKHGIKMTGMPAFGGSESDETIRNIAAFVDRMEGMTPAQYAELKERWRSPEEQPQGEGHPGDGHAGHEH